MYHTLTTHLIRLPMLIVLSFIVVVCAIPQETKAAASYCTGSVPNYECCYADGTCIAFAGDTSGTYWYNDASTGRSTASAVAVDILSGASESTAGSTCTTSNGYNCYVTCANGVHAYTSTYPPSLAGSSCTSNGSTATLHISWAAPAGGGATKYGALFESMSPCPSGWSLSSGWCTYGITSGTITGTSIDVSVVPGTTYITETSAFGAFIWSGYTSPWTTSCPATTVAGSCGSATSYSGSTAPSTGFCSAGTYASDVSGNGSQWTWHCNGSGTPVGAIATCHATQTAACVPNQGSTCTSSPNSCGMTNSGTVECNGLCTATTPANSLCPPTPTCVPNQGSSCTSGANSCGMTNSGGTVQCNGTCSATTPPDSSCPPTGTPDLTTVGTVTPATATANVPVTLSATIKNAGTASRARASQISSRSIRTPSPSPSQASPRSRPMLQRRWVLASATPRRQHTPSLQRAPTT